MRILLKMQLPLRISLFKTFLYVIWQLDMHPLNFTVLLGATLTCSAEGIFPDLASPSKTSKKKFKKKN